MLAASPASCATPGARVPRRGHGDHRVELRPPVGLVPEHHGGRHLRHPAGRRAAHPWRSGARACRAGHQGHSVAVQFYAPARGPDRRMRPAADPAILPPRPPAVSAPARTRAGAGPRTQIGRECTRQLGWQRSRGVRWAGMLVADAGTFGSTGLGGARTACS
jgi:hypothetical protein